MTILVINCGSSSIKFSLIDVEQQTKLLVGIVEQLNQAEAAFKFTYKQQQSTQTISQPTYQIAFEHIFSVINKHFELSSITAVGHRVVHGGEAFSHPILIDDEVLATIKQGGNLAPLHNPANCFGIELSRSFLSSTPQIAVFDTAFHQTMPKQAYIYALPYSLYEQHGLRRYGFHGTSHEYIAQVAAKRLNKPHGNFISAHLGNGCSVCAIKEGKSVDTSMGLTPLEGLVMGTRAGDVDPGLIVHLIQTLGYTIEQVNDLLNKQSGLLGLSQFNSDMRALTTAANEGNQQAQLAIDIFCYRLAKYIAAMLVPVGKLDALIFTAGIGENNPQIRAKTCEWLTNLGIIIDPEHNNHHGIQQQGLISSTQSIPVFVIATDEEYAIAYQAYQQSQ